jgi:hypothetical protein
MKLKIGVKKSSLKFLARARNFENILNGALIRASKESGAEIVKIMKEIMKVTPWAKNDPQYKAWKASHGYATDPLFRTNLLYNSVSHETIVNLPKKIGGEVGWHSGARYGGNLGQRQWTRAVPKRRKKDLGPPDTEVGRYSHKDNNYLAQVAEWNEYGMGQRVTHTEETYTVRNGRKRSGEQRYKTKVRSKYTLSRMGRHPRPFVARTKDKIPDKVFVIFKSATMKVFDRIYGKKKYADVPI